MRIRQGERIGLARAALGTIAALAVLAAAPAGAAAATTYHASPNGSGAECSASSPCTTGEALAKASSGDTVIMAGDEGTYGTPGSPIVPELQVRDGVALEGAAGQPMPQIYSHGASAAIRLGEGGTGQRLSNVAIHEEFGGEALVGSGTVERVLALASSGGGCRLEAPGATVLDSVCAGSSGIFDILNSGSGTLPLTLRNDTIYGTETGLLAFSEGPKFQIAAVNTIFHGTEVADIETGNTGGEVTVGLDHSNYATLVNPLGGTVTPAGSGTNQLAAPLFENAAGRDFSQLNDSPTIDAGATEAANGSTDLLGNPRSLLGRTITCNRFTPGPTDIGAYEFVPPPTACPPSVRVTLKPFLTASISGAKIRKHKATFHFQGSGEEGLGFECKLDQKPFRPCTSPKSYKHLKPGKHKFSVRAIDAAGNQSAPAGRKFRIQVRASPRH
jgi:hypothetical protein